MNEKFCKYLRTKTMYVDATQAEALADKEGEYVTPCHLWCNLTQTVVGPDDGPVQKEACSNSARSCFEA